MSSFLIKVLVEWTVFWLLVLGPSPTGTIKLDLSKDCLIVQGAAEGVCHSHPSLQRKLALYRLPCGFRTRGSQLYEKPVPVTCLQSSQELVK